MVFALTGFFSATIDTSQQGQSKSTSENMMFKFQNGQVVFTGFDDVSKVYISRHKGFDVFNHSKMVKAGAEIQFCHKFKQLKECNFSLDRRGYFGENTADSARAAFNYESSEIFDETKLMVQIQEFDFADPRGVGILYMFEQHGMIVTWEEDEKDENGEYPEDYDPLVTPFRMMCYGIRRHDSDEIKLLALEDIRLFVYGNRVSIPAPALLRSVDEQEQKHLDAAAERMRKMWMILEQQDAATAARRAALAERMRQARGNRAVI